MKVDWRKKLGAHHRGVHPLLVEAADHIESLEQQLQNLRDILSKPGRFHRYNKGIHASDCSGCELLAIVKGGTP